MNNVYRQFAHQAKRKLKNLRKKKTLAWKFVLLFKRIFWPPYETIRTSLAWPYEHRKYDPIRRDLIQDKRILIIGSGPSAASLNTLPEDCVILTCKRALKLFQEKGFHREVDLFLCCKGAMERNPIIEDLLLKIRANVLVMDDLNYTRGLKRLKTCYDHLIPDDGKDNFYLKKLIGKDTLRSFKKKNGPVDKQKILYHVSSGLRLLQYALYFEAKEIYLIGIDLNDNGYFWGEPKKQKHIAIDNYFLRQAAKKYRNIYSLSPNSPICRYVPYKDPREVTSDSNPKPPLPGASTSASSETEQRPLSKLALSLYRYWYGFKYALYRQRSRPILKKLIKDKTVFIVGSGPSARELDSIPENALAFTCNAGLRLWIEKNFQREIDLYLCNNRKLLKKEVAELIPKTRIGVFVTDDMNFIKQKKSLKDSYRTLLRYDMQRNYYLKSLVKPYRFQHHKTPSVGIRLLEYALYFGAKEIYLIGIDLSDSGYFWGGENKQKHTAVDINFLKIISRKYENVYSLSKKSPLSNYLPHKTF